MKHPNEIKISRFANKTGRRTDEIKIPYSVASEIKIASKCVTIITVSPGRMKPVDRGHLGEYDIRS